MRWSTTGPTAKPFPLLRHSEFSTKKRCMDGLMLPWFGSFRTSAKRWIFCPSEVDPCWFPTTRRGPAQVLGALILKNPKVSCHLGYFELGERKAPLQRMIEEMKVAPVVLEGRRVRL